MALFGRKEEDYDDEGYVEEEELKFPKKRIRDLNSANKKRRKEPLKPWGKRERMIILVTFLFTVLVSALLIVSSTIKSGGRVNFPKIDFSSLNLFEEQTIIIEKK